MQHAEGVGHVAFGKEDGAAAVAHIGVGAAEDEEIGEVGQGEMKGLRPDRTAPLWRPCVFPFRPKVFTNVRDGVDVFRIFYKIEK